MAFELGAWSERVLVHVDAALDATLQSAWPPDFLQAVRYPVFGGGKRFRPLLCFAGAEACGVAGEVATAAAASVELVHTYSLVHDDLPCMDDDALRRGRPTVHVAYGEASALLVGDALLTEAFGVLAREGSLPADTRLALVRLLVAAVGKDGMVGGQEADLKAGRSALTATALADIHARKTGALIRAAVVMGGVSAGCSDVVAATLGEIGGKIGQIFQITDDLLDADEDDAAPNYVHLYGVEGTRALVDQLTADVLEAIATLPAPDALLALTRWVRGRTS